MGNKVCFVTLSRSDYASLRPVMLAARADPDIDVNLVAGGSHLLKRFGESIVDIGNDTINIDATVDFLGEEDDTDLDLARAYGRAYDAFVECFQRLQPHAVFILGDRWEMLAVATAASLLRIPIIHHSGGDITQGSRDNQTRYAISVLAHIHLVALEQHRQRLISLGEEEWRVIRVGEPALCALAESVKRAGDIRRFVGLEDRQRFVLATFHPTSYDTIDFSRQATVFVQALALIGEAIVLTAPNPDPGSGVCRRILQDFAHKHKRVYWFENLGADRYHAAMSEADYMIGNSSSGVWEAPSFGLPVINIGSRQRDRLRAGNVIDVDFDASAIEGAIDQIAALRQSPGLQQRQNPYGDARTLERIMDAIKTRAPNDKLLAKLLVDPLAGP